MEPDGTDRRSFDTYGTVGGLSYDHSYGGGCLTAQWTLAAPAYFSDQGARIGRSVEIFDGVQRVWTGRLKEPERGVPWTFRAEGFQSALADYSCVDTGGPPYLPTTDPNAAITAAQARGLPVTVPDLLPTVDQITDPPATIADLLNQTADLSGQKWQVDRDGHLTMAGPPTGCDYLYVLLDTFGRSLDGYATDMWVKFVDSTDSTVKMVTAGPLSGVRPFGRVEQVIDLTGTDHPPMLPTDAQLLADAARDLLGERINFTNTLTCLPGQLLSPGGLPVRLSTVTAGQTMRLVGASTDAGIGEASYSAGVQVVIGQTSYDAVADVLQITPWNAQRQDLTGALEDLYGALTRTGAIGVGLSGLVQLRTA
jgi:hypothetical protein